MAAERFDRSDLVLLLVAVIGGVLFFSSLDRLWPLADIDLQVPPEKIEQVSRTFLIAQGIEVREHVAASRLEVDEELLDYLLRAFGHTETQQLIRRGEPVYLYHVLFKRSGDPDSAWTLWHPRAGVVAWGRTMQEDAPGAVVEVEVARRTSADAVAAAIGLRLGEFQESGEVERARPARRDHVFIYEHFLSRTPELRRRVTLTVAGGNLTAVQRELVIPEQARRDARQREAPVVALQMAGILFVGAAGLIALVVFLSRLQKREIMLKRAAGWVSLIALFFLITQALRSADLLLRWDPLWPRWVATFQSLGFTLAQGAWIAFALFVVIAAGDALDRESGSGRGDSLWIAGRGEWLDHRVGLASLRGFLIGLVCGGALVVTLLLMQTLAGAKVAIQPQAFFFFAINSDLPALSTLLYFLMVALIEEIGYRFFAGTWLMSRTRSRLVAIAIPALLYGTTHTGLGFIPPYEPFWGRAVAFTVVGCIWGWAFFRYDALTVVLSHFAADLFIFNWPRLGSGDPVMVTKAVLTFAVPLLPALLLLRPDRRRDPSDDRIREAGDARTKSS
ncbi:MAG TPA: type II CAAX endopeptidase family protein [Thermoanaerobaculia bacterium]|nr:type II CAAX endopeptidase family protein [Thermoanaerobaculia bacterium]